MHFKEEKKMTRINELNEMLKREIKEYEEHLETAEKYGVANWTYEDHQKWSDACPTTDGMWLANEEDVTLNGVWYDLQASIKHLNKITGEMRKIYEKDIRGTNKGK